MTNGSASGQCSVDAQRSVHKKQYRRALEHGENSIGERLERNKHTHIYIYIYIIDNIYIYPANGGVYTNGAEGPRMTSDTGTPWA